MVLESIYSFISLYSVEVNIGSIIGLLLLFILYIHSQYKLKKISKRYKSLVTNNSGINIEDILLNNQRSISEIGENIKEIEKNISSLELRQSFAVTKVGFIRYDAFYDVGNELSYSIALMDTYNSGFVLSSLYGRESSVNYAKPLKNGESRIPLSAEEQLAIDRAIKGENVEKVF